MKRLALLVLVLAAFGVPSAAHAAVPCRDRIYNDWYADGKIATTYPIACYKSALAHIPADARIYSNLANDIHTAMQAAILRERGRKVPAEVGKGTTTTGHGGSANHSVNQTKTTTTSSSSSTNSSPTTTLASSSTSSSSGGGVPLPIIVLGAVAILLAATGAIGAGVRHLRNRQQP
jgi:hypothetical protein